MDKPHTQASGALGAHRQHGLAWLDGVDVCARTGKWLREVPRARTQVHHPCRGWDEGQKPTHQRLRVARARTVGLGEALKDEGRGTSRQGGRPLT